MPAVAERDPAPPQLSDVINCQCNAMGKKCSTEACGCHREHLSCTNYCNCRGHDDCCNPHTPQGVMRAVDDDNAEIDGAGEEMRMLWSLLMERMNMLTAITWTTSGNRLRIAQL